MSGPDVEPWRRAEIDSPCVRVCVLHPETGLCIGCKRSGAEIAAWSRMTPEARCALTAALPTREAAPTQRRGGRKGRRG